MKRMSMDGTIFSVAHSEIHSRRIDDPEDELRCHGLPRP